MKLTKNLTPILATLLLLSLVSGTVPSLAPVSAAPDGQAEPSLHRLHLDYDKGTGRWLVDPAARTRMPGPAAEDMEIGSLPAGKQTEADPTRITFRSGSTIHPGPGMAPGVREALAATGDMRSDGFWLIQFRYPFPTGARTLLEDAGVAFFEYLDVSAFYARIPPVALPLLERMLETGEVRYVGAVPADAKVKPGLAADAVRDPQSEREILVLTFDESNEAQLEELGRWMLIEGQSTGPVHIVEGRAPGGSILALANLGFVRWVEEKSQAELGNLDGGMGVGADLVRTTGVDGTGVQVMVVDSGIAQQGDTYHPDLQGDRILDQWDYYRGDEIAEDEFYLGHGTHVAGTIGGRHNPGDADSEQSYQGVAPGSSLLIYKLFGPLPQSIAGWFADAMDQATSEDRTAHVSNNSWGGGSGIYNLYSEIADAAVRGDYNDVRVNVVAAAMNDGDYVRAPGTGKNVITVGAVKDGNYPNAPLPDLGYGCEPDDWPPGERLCYSNYGPIDTDGDEQKRVKPDLMAPGALITSAVPWYLPLYPGQYYGDLHGTSQATPHVTGAIAQLLDAYSDLEGGALFDWPEMVKAMLLATAVDVGGDTDLYGHGLLDAYHAVYAEPGVDQPMDLWGGSVSGSGEVQDFDFYVPAGYEQVRVVLTWADPAGATEVVNDLDILGVRDGGGTWRSGASSLDDTVEYVRIPAVWEYAPGTWTIRVRATSIGDAPQPFALAAHVILADADLSIRAMPSSIPGVIPSFIPGAAFYLNQYVSNTGYTAGGSYAELQVPEGFTVRGATLYTQDGYGHWYDASELHHDLVDDTWHVALGETLAVFERRVRWEIEIDEGLACAGYPFESTVYWLQGGSERSSSMVVTQVPVVCHSFYLPLVLRDR